MTKALHDTRRRLLGGLLGVAASASAVASGSGAAPADMRAPARPAARAIPSTGETLPVIGLGSWITFNIGRDPVALDECAEIVRVFLESGCTLIDSSPMYGSAQDTIGQALARLDASVRQRAFSADKVWTGSGDRGPSQVEESRRRWGIERFDLLQVHNLLAWDAHLPMLFAMKAEGRLRYIGITTSEGRRHPEIERIMRAHPIDFLQLSYNIIDREAERRLLPMARERGIAVIANRPFRQGDLIRAVKRHPLPAWAAELDCRNWAQVLLKFVVSHPDVHCAIPATSRVAHLRENLGAAHGPMPDADMRRRMADHVARL